MGEKTPRPDRANTYLSPRWWCTQVVASARRKSRHCSAVRTACREQSTMCWSSATSPSEKTRASTARSVAMAPARAWPPARPVNPSPSPDSVPGLPHNVRIVRLNELRCALISYQEYHMLLLTPAGRGRHSSAARAAGHRRRRAQQSAPAAAEQLGEPSPGGGRVNSDPLHSSNPIQKRQVQIPTKSGYLSVLLNGEMSIPGIT